MQIFIVKKDSNLQRLIAGAPAASVQQLQRFNPHVDLTKLAPGAVLVIPDGLNELEFPSGNAESIAAEAFDGFADFAKDALQASAARLRAAADRAGRNAETLTAAANSKGVTEAAGRDPELKGQLEQAVKQAQEDSRAATAGLQAFDTLTRTALTELQALGKRLA